MKDLIGTVQQLLAPVKRRVDNMVARAVVSLVDDAAALQLLQIRMLDDEVRNRCERFQEYGFTSVPMPGAEAAVLFVGGYRDHPLVVAVDDRQVRPTGLQPGEVAIYTDQGDQIIIRRGGAIEIVASTSVTVTSPTVSLSGDLTVQGNVTVNGGTGVSVPSGDVIAGAIHLKTHKHTGVQTGGGTTGGPTP